MRTIGPTIAYAACRGHADRCAGTSGRHSVSPPTTGTEVRKVRSKPSVYAELRAVVLALLAGRPTEP